MARGFGDVYKTESKWLYQKDFEEPNQVTIARIGEAEFDRRDGKKNPDGTPMKDHKYVLWFKDPQRADFDLEKGWAIPKIVASTLAVGVGQTTWDKLSEFKFDGINPDEWVGTRVEVFRDASVSFGSDITGGLRLKVIDAPAGQMPVQANPTTQLKPGLSDESKAKLGAVLELHSERLGVDMAEMRKFALDHFQLTTVTETNVQPLIDLFGVLEINSNGSIEYPGDQVEVPF